MIEKLLNQPSVLLFTFLITSTGIVGLSFLFSESIKNIMDRFKLSENFIGSSLLATGTSLPEAINAITAGIYDKTNNNGDKFQYSLNSLYNLTGAISIQIVFLSSVTLFIWRNIRKRKGAGAEEYKLFTSSVFKQKEILWSIYTIELVALILFFIFSDASSKLEFGHFNVITLIFLIIWILYMLSIKRTNENEIQLEKYTNIFQKYKNRQFIFVFILIFFFFVILAFLNFNLVSKFEKVFKIPKNIGLGTILSLVTSFPEFASFFFLYKSKCYGTACAGFFGSALFNLMLPFFTQLIQGNWLFTTLSNNGERHSLTIWLGSILLINLMFAASFYKKSKNSYIFNIQNEKWTPTVNVLTVLTWFAFSLLFPIFS